MLTLNPTLQEQFAAFSVEASSANSFSEREQLLAMLTASFLLEDADLLRQTVIMAKLNGIINDEIAHVSALVVATCKQKAGCLEKLGMEQHAPKSSCSQTATCL